ncbi:hypothetical protein, partial [Planosporangium flavigriseum]|uniref:hypothetical protein n=1 Tax=Planosporangium flavigriseum TaxID=373681 RepID=UPI00194F3A12
MSTVALRWDVDAADDCPALGSMVRRAGRLGTGHAAYVALPKAAGVVTSRAHEIRAVLGDRWHIREV